MANPSQWKRRLGRITSMPRQELVDRLRQFLSARADLWRFRRGHNFLGALHGGLAAEGRFFFTPAEIPALIAELKQVFPAQADAIALRAERICRHRFDLLGYEDLDYGSQIDWQ